MALIEIRGLSTVFGPHPKQALAQARSGLDKAGLLARTGHTLALQDVELDIEAGEIFVIMGLSGSGKSTLVRHINRLITPTEGQVRVDGQDVTTMSAGALMALRRRRLAMVFQGFGLLRHRRVIDNVAYGLEVRGVARAQRDQQALQWIERVGLAGYAHHRPAQLSGGMQQRVGLARALCAGTDIILMDEPFSALDPLTRAQLQGDLLQLQADLGKTIVFITHDLDEALRLGNRLAILDEGRPVQVGAPQDVLTHPANDHVAAFVQQVNRARALRIGEATVPWPAGLPLPSLHDAVEANETIEQMLDRLIGASTPLAVKRGDAIVGQVSLDAVRALLVLRK